MSAVEPSRARGCCWAWGCAGGAFRQGSTTEGWEGLTVTGHAPNRAGQGGTTAWLWKVVFSKCQPWWGLEDWKLGEGWGKTIRLSLLFWGIVGSGGASESGSEAWCLMYTSGRRVIIGVWAQWFLWVCSGWLQGGQWGIFLFLPPWLQLRVNLVPPHSWC